MATPTASAGNPVKQDEATMRLKGYNAVVGAIAKTPDGSGGTLYGIQGICQGSADGHCQKVFFFLDGRFLGTDTGAPSNEIKSVRAGGAAKVDVVYGNYRTSDPLCCPSGQPVTIDYTWNGTRLVASGRPPGH